MKSASAPLPNVTRHLESGPHERGSDQALKASSDPSGGISSSTGAESNGRAPATDEGRERYLGLI